MNSATEQTRRIREKMVAVRHELQHQTVSIEVKYRSITLIKKNKNKQFLYIKVQSFFKAFLQSQKNQLNLFVKKRCKSTVCIQNRYITLHNHICSQTGLPSKQLSKSKCIQLLLEVKQSTDYKYHE